MRRAQSVRLHSRNSLSSAAGNPGSSQLALHTDDLGVLREGDESDADVLRKQLLEKDRECDRLKTNLSLLQSQLTLRPPIEHIQALEREYKDLELLLQGTQRENERCMTEMERMKIREKMLERELARLAGENWQVSLDFSPPPPTNMGTLGRSSSVFHHRSNTAPTAVRMTMDASSNSSSSTNSGSYSRSPLNPSSSPSINTQGLAESPIQEDGSLSDADGGVGAGTTDPVALAAHIDKIRLLILGMETRLSKREGDLIGMVSRAEGEGKKWEELARSGGGVKA